MERRDSIGCCGEARIDEGIRASDSLSSGDFNVILLLVGVGELQTHDVVLVKAITLKSVDADGGLQGVFEVRETEQYFEFAIGIWNAHIAALDGRN